MLNRPGTAPLEIWGYHGTTRDFAKSIMSTGFRVSENPYDWLGSGIYFFQDAPKRAEKWAVNRFGEASAAVVGARILLDDCMDFLDVEWCAQLRKSFDLFQRLYANLNKKMPRQTQGAHRLDKHVIDFLVEKLGENGIILRTVRGVFVEGDPVFPDSALMDLSHVQVAVRDVVLIKDPWIVWEGG